MCVTQVMYEIPRYFVHYRMVLGNLHNFIEYLQFSGIMYNTWPLLGNLPYICPASQEIDALLPKSIAVNISAVNILPLK